MKLGWLPVNCHRLVRAEQYCHWLITNTLLLTGLANLKALNDVVLWQKLEYDFEFHALTFNTDYPSVITSTGRSLFSVSTMRISYYNVN